MKPFILLSVVVGIGGGVIAGPVPANDPSIVGWATGYQDLIRGPIDISNPDGDLASFGDPNDVIGPSGADGGVHPVVSLGDGGSIVLTFANLITNGPGADFAVFENSHSTFYELAFVEVSSDGLNFVRFDAVSLTQTDTQIAPFGTLNPADITNLAGKDLAGYGTPFDLEELAGAPGLNVNAVTHVRIIDVVGSIDPAYARTDSLGNIINDPWKTDFVEGNGGFDLDAVGVIHAIPEPSVLFLLFVGMGLVIRHAHRNRS
ncbi:MAG: PEP-CTERM sorting domain-containing protein [Kiritimatiellia bacterium]